MLNHKFVGLLAGFATFGLSNAACRLTNVIDVQPPLAQTHIETRPELCTTQADGNYQLSLYVTEVSVPTFDGDNPFAGVAGTDTFLLYSSDCHLLGVYSRSNEIDCGVPYEIDFFRVDPPISIYNVWLGVGDPRFCFDFLGESYCTPNDAKCGGCGDMSDGLRAEQGCKCGFYVLDIGLEGGPPGLRS